MDLQSGAVREAAGSLVERSALRVRFRLPGVQGWQAWRLVLLS